VGNGRGTWSAGSVLGGGRIGFLVKEQGIEEPVGLVGGVQGGEDAPAGLSAISAAEG
jgi:hypothetical protein